MNADMSWQAALILCGLTFVGVAWAYCYVASRSDKFISNKELDAHRITPRFDNNDEESA